MLNGIQEGFLGPLFPCFSIKLAFFAKGMDVHLPKSDFSRGKMIDVTSTHCYWLKQGWRDGSLCKGTSLPSLTTRVLFPDPHFLQLPHVHCGMHRYKHIHMCACPPPPGINICMLLAQSIWCDLYVHDIRDGQLVSDNLLGGSSSGKTVSCSWCSLLSVVLHLGWGPRRIPPLC